jgi:tetratricopeptide (TPR) repeat protein
VGWEDITRQSYFGGGRYAYFWGMPKKILCLSFLLIMPLGLIAQPGSGLVVLSVFRLLKGTGLESARAEEVHAPVELDWSPREITPKDREKELKVSLMQCKRRIIALNNRLDAHPDSADLYRQRAILHTNLYDGNNALLDLTKARENHVDHPELDYEFARAYLAIGSLTKAQASADTYLQRVPNDPRGYLLKAVAEVSRQKGDHQAHCQAALPDLNRALAIDSTLLAARLLRGYSLATTEQFAAAIADYQQVLAVSPQHAQVNFFMAEALLGAGGTSQACMPLVLAEPFAPRTSKGYHKKYCR